MLNRLPLMLILVFLSLNIKAQINQDCPNANFAMGDFTNWGGYTGTCCPINVPNIGIVAGRHTIMNPGTDPIVPALQTVPNGFTRSARLGNSSTGAQAEALEYNLNVTAQNSLFIYDFAVVLEDPGHSASQQPRFEVQVIDPFGQVIPCTFYQVAAGNNIPGFQSYPGGVWRNWARVGVSLANYIGQTVTIQAKTGDCSLSGHYGYGYLVADCAPLQIDIRYCQGDTNAVLVAPPGFSSYQWSNGVTGNTVVINNPQSGQSLNCVITSASGCTATLTAVVNPITAFAGFGNVFLCGDMALMSDTSYALNGNITKWAWDYGDGTPSFQDSAQNPFHLFPGPGIYNVTQIAISSAGCRDTITLPVSVFPRPESNLILPDPCGLTQQFTSLATIDSLGSNGNWSANTIVSHAWNFLDTTGFQVGASVDTNPVFTFPQPGYYDIQLVVADSLGCTDTITIPYLTVGTPLADFTFSDFCEGLITPFADTSFADGDTITSRLWNLGDGTQLTDSTLFSHMYANPGTYNAQLIILTANNCPDTVNYPVTVFPNPVANFAVDSACSGDTTNFINLSMVFNPDSIVGSAWVFNTGVGSSSQTNPAQVFPGWGPYTATLAVVTNNGCVDTITLPLQVNPRPVIDFTADPLEGCQPLTVDMLNTTYVPGPDTVSVWNWAMGDGGTTTGVLPTYTYMLDGTFSVTLTAITNRGCDTTVTINNLITVHPKPNADYAWANNSDFCFKESLFTDNQSTVNAPSSITDYNWIITAPSNILYTDSNENFNNVFPEVGSYDVVLYIATDQGCLDTTVGTFNVLELPIADFESEPYCYWINLFTDQTTQGEQPYNYQWNIDQTPGADYFVANFEHFYADSTQGNIPVVLSITDAFGCRHDTLKVIEVKGSPDDFDFPNVLVLNPETVGNDQVQIEDLSAEFNICVDYELFVYNRWGTLVFKTQNTTVQEGGIPDVDCAACFRGLHQDGTELTTGVYHYILRSEKRDITKQGFISVFKR